MSMEKSMGVGYEISIHEKSNTQYQVSVTLDGFVLETAFLHKDMFYRNPVNQEKFLKNLQELLAHLKYGYSHIGKMAHLASAVVKLLTLYNKGWQEDISELHSTNVVEFHEGVSAALQYLARYEKSHVPSYNPDTENIMPIFAAREGRFSRSIAPLIYFFYRTLRRIAEHIFGVYAGTIVQSMMDEHMSSFHLEERWGIPYRLVYVALKEMSDDAPRIQELRGYPGNALHVLRSIASMDVVRYMALMYDDPIVVDSSLRGSPTNRCIRDRIKANLNDYINQTKKLFPETIGGTQEKDPSEDANRMYVASRVFRVEKRTYTTTIIPPLEVATNRTDPLPPIDINTLRLNKLIYQIGSDGKSVDKAVTKDVAFTRSISRGEGWWTCDNVFEERVFAKEETSTLAGRIVDSCGMKWIHNATHLRVDINVHTGEMVVDSRCIATYSTASQLWELPCSLLLKGFSLNLEWK